jgi:hypothetical protein
MKPTNSDISRAKKISKEYNKEKSRNPWGANSTANALKHIDH